MHREAKIREIYNKIFRQKVRKATCEEVVATSSDMTNRQPNMFPTDKVHYVEEIPEEERDSSSDNEIRYIEECVPEEHTEVMTDNPLFGYVDKTPDRCVDVDGTKYFMGDKKIGGAAKTKDEEQGNLVKITYYPDSDVKY